MIYTRLSFPGTDLSTYLSLYNDHHGSHSPGCSWLSPSMWRCSATGWYGTRPPVQGQALQRPVSIFPLFRLCGIYTMPGNFTSLDLEPTTSILQTQLKWRPSWKKSAWQDSTSHFLRVDPSQSPMRDRAQHRKDQLNSDDQQKASSSGPSLAVFWGQLVFS